MLSDTLPRPVCCPLRIYIAGPYSGPEKRANVGVARLVAQTFFRWGHWPYCPHTATLDWEEQPEPEFQSYEWLVNGLDFAWLRCCDAIYLLPGWEQSKGACMEEAEARRLGLWMFTSMGEVPAIKPDDGGRQYLMRRRDEFSQACRRGLICGEAKHGDSWKTLDNLAECYAEIRDRDNYAFLDSMQVEMAIAQRDGRPWPAQDKLEGVNDG